MHRWVDHAAELELELEAASEREVFEEALVALGGLLAERAGEEDEDAHAQAARHEVNASAPDRATLLAEWLSELAYLAESEGFVPRSVERLTLSGGSLEATAVGRHGSPPHLVKAVTYHRLGMWKEHEIWRARVIFDV